MSETKQTRSILDLADPSTTVGELIAHTQALNAGFAATVLRKGRKGEVVWAVMAATEDAAELLRAAELLTHDDEHIRRRTRDALAAVELLARQLALRRERER